MTTSNMTKGGSKAPVKKEEKVTGILKASDVLAGHLKMDPRQMVNIIKAQCFTGTDANKVSDEMLGAYVNVAHSLTEKAPGFNPLLPGMLYAYPTRNGGIQPMIGPDGIYALLSSRDDVEGFDSNAELDQNGKVVSALAWIKVTGKTTFQKRVWLSEWRISSNPNWSTRPAHMLEIRALKQVARMVIHGIPLDREEMEIVIEQEAKRVTRDPEPGKPRASLLAEQIREQQDETEPEEERQEAAEEEVDENKAQSEEAERDELPFDIDDNGPGAYDDSRR